MCNDHDTYDHYVNMHDCRENTSLVVLTGSC